MGPEYPADPELLESMQIRDLSELRARALPLGVALIVVVLMGLYVSQINHSPPTSTQTQIQQD